MIDYDILVEGDKKEKIERMERVDSDHQSIIVELKKERKFEQLKEGRS